VISNNFQTFCNGHTSGLHWISIGFARGALYDFVWFPYMLKGTPLRISLDFHCFARGTPYDFGWFPYTLQWTAIRIWLDFQKTFRKGHPLGFYWTPLGFHRPLPDILQWVPPRINFHSLHVLCKGYPLRFHWISFYLRGVVLKTWTTFHILCKGTIRISLGLHLFGRGTP
jgi:hypothetical protein